MALWGLSGAPGVARGGGPEMGPVERPHRPSAYLSGQHPRVWERNPLVRVHLPDDYPPLSESFPLLLPVADRRDSEHRSSASASIAPVIPTAHGWLPFNGRRWTP